MNGGGERARLQPQLPCSSDEALVLRPRPADGIFGTSDGGVRVRVVATDSISDVGDAIHLDLGVVRTARCSLKGRRSARNLNWLSHSKKPEQKILKS